MLHFYFVCEFLLKYIFYICESLDWNSFRFNECDARNGISVFIHKPNGYIYEYFIISIIIQPQKLNVNAFL